MKKEITIYTKTYCPYCIMLKRFLKKNDVTFTDIEVSNNPEIHQKIIQETGHKTVPAVFADKEFIGGSEDFYEWYSKNS